MRCSCATQSMIGEAAKRGLDEYAVLCNSAVLEIQMATFREGTFLVHLYPKTGTTQPSRGPIKLSLPPPFSLHFRLLIY